MGKHCWKFLNQPQSLVARLYKARYYSDTHFLKSSKGSGPSFIWTGIHTAKEALYKGYRWVVGYGMDINATKDPWIRSKSGFKVDQSSTYTGRDEMVSHWFLPGLKQWYIDRVKMHFDEEDAKAILMIPIPHREVRDRVAWVESADEQFHSRLDISIGKTKQVGLLV